MSTCPDKDLYSVYVDGELESSWKEKIEEHLASCEKCKRVVDSYRTISLKLSENSSPDLNIQGSFLKLYAKRQDCLKRMEINRNKPTSWMYKSNKIPIPALAAAALFLFVLTPIVVLSTQKSLTPSESVAVSEFKSAAPTTENLKSVNKFKLNVSNIFGSNENAIIFEGKPQEINLSKYANLYLPPSNETNSDILNKNIKNETLFFDYTHGITVTSFKNGK
ncbi:anti-sigma factor family protein [Treponema putidum]|uniref:anti-sigma factor family protein n=1 Tax=Treponema putidum TaxID=221027 RepID=UPI002104727E|nr:zf-HC2 domain-containing protein [Treponema putidum]UTY32257.1 zf-HC2 domain-containing protein [Treponema putidum]